MDHAHLIGAVGATISFLLFIPQAQPVWTNRAQPERLKGISIVGQILIIANAAVWGLYATTAGAFWTGAPGIVNAPLAVAVIVLVLRSRRRPTAKTDCPLCIDGRSHHVFITAPPGYGSLMPCTPDSRRRGVVQEFEPVHPASMEAAS